MFRRLLINLAIRFIQNANPLHFAAECLRWFRRNTEEYPNPKGFSNQDM